MSSKWYSRDQDPNLMKDKVAKITGGIANKFKRKKNPPNFTVHKKKKKNNKNLNLPTHNISSTQKLLTMFSQKKKKLRFSYKSKIKELFQDFLNEDLNSSLFPGSSGYLEFPCAVYGKLYSVSTLLCEKTYTSQHWQSGMNFNKRPISILNIAQFWPPFFFSVQIHQGKANFLGYSYCSFRSCLTWVGSTSPWMMFRMEI